VEKNENFGGQVGSTLGEQVHELSITTAVIIA
jgi:hypothetical protein